MKTALSIISLYKRLRFLLYFVCLENLQFLTLYKMYHDVNCSGVNHVIRYLYSPTYEPPLFLIIGFIQYPFPLSAFIF